MGPENYRCVVAPNIRRLTTCPHVMHIMSAGFPEIRFAGIFSWDYRLKLFNSVIMAVIPSPSRGSANYVTCGLQNVCTSVTGGPRCADRPAGRQNIGADPILSPGKEREGDPQQSAPARCGHFPSDHRTNCSRFTPRDLLALPIGGHLNWARRPGQKVHNIRTGAEL